MMKMNIKNQIRLVILSNFILIIANLLIIYFSFNNAFNEYFINDKFKITDIKPILTVLMFTYLGTLIISEVEMFKDTKLRFIPLINNYVNLYNVIICYINLEKYINIVLDRLEENGINDSDLMIKRLLNEDIIMFFDILSFVTIDDIVMNNKYFIKEIITRLEKRKYDVFYMKTILNNYIFSIYVGFNEKYVFSYYFDGCKEEEIIKYRKIKKEV